MREEGAIMEGQVAELRAQLREQVGAGGVAHGGKSQDLMLPRATQGVTHITVAHLPEIDQCTRLACQAPLCNAV